MYYILKPLTDELIFIKWYRTPTSSTKPQIEFVPDLHQRLKTSPHPLYFLSDLRLGRIIDVATIQKLGQLTKHENYGGGSAFSKDVISEIFVGVFSKFATPEKGTSVFYDTVEEALAYLEAFKPGLAQGIDWNTLFVELDGGSAKAGR